VAIGAATTWVLIAGDVSELAADVTAELPFGLVLAPGETDAWQGSAAPLRVDSDPANAHVIIDGRERGVTPLVVQVTPGLHAVGLKHPDALDELRRVDVTEDGAELDVNLWRRRPTSVRLRPPYPGSTIADASFLGDGRIALIVTLPERASNGTIGAWREAWLLDPRTGAVNRFETPGFAAPRSQTVAVSPDGHLVAYLQQSPGTSMEGPAAANRLNEIWVASANGDALIRAFTLPPVTRPATYGSAEVEQLIGLAWAPDGRRLLVATRMGEPINGPVRGRLLVLDVTRDDTGSPPVELVTMPASAVPGSYSWAPNGRWVAFLARAASAPGGRNLITLNAVDTTTESSGRFRYVSDLGRADGSGVAAALPVAPVAWEPSGSATSVGRLLYSAPVAAVRNASGGPFGLLVGPPAEPPQALFIAAPDAPTFSVENNVRVGTAAGVFAPIWRAIGPDSVVALSRAEGGGKGLTVSSVELGSGRVQDLGVQLPADVASSATAVGARWDESRGQAIVVARPGSTRTVTTDGAVDGLDFWLVEFTGADRPPAGGSRS